MPGCVEPGVHAGERLEPAVGPERDDADRASTSRGCRARRAAPAGRRCRPGRRPRCARPPRGAARAEHRGRVEGLVVSRTRRRGRSRRGRRRGRRPGRRRRTRRATARAAGARAAERAHAAARARAPRGGRGGRSRAAPRPGRHEPRVERPPRSARPRRASATSTRRTSVVLAPGPPRHAVGGAMTTCGTSRGVSCTPTTLRERPRGRDGKASAPTRRPAAVKAPLHALRARMLGAPRRRRRGPAAASAHAKLGRRVDAGLARVAAASATSGSEQGARRRLRRRAVSSATLARLLDGEDRLERRDGDGELGQVGLARGQPLELHPGPHQRRAPSGGGGSCRTT